MGKFVLKSQFNEDEYTAYVCAEYDIQDKEITTTEIPILKLEEIEDDNWNILLLLGNSGSGKSTILRSLGDISESKYDENKPIISQFPNLTPKEVCDLFCSVGLSSVPTWLRKPHELSNGERARLDLCASIANNDGIILIDEFTSVVNRDVAKSMSYALQRYVREKDKKIILASCHFDLVNWLRPDYIFNINKKNEDGESELEKIIYNDEEEYIAYQSIKEKDILSDAKSIS